MVRGKAWRDVEFETTLFLVWHEHLAERGAETARGELEDRFGGRIDVRTVGESLNERELQIPASLT